MKILLANNKEINNRTIQSYLQKNGYQVLTTNSYPETMEQIDQYHPDIIITDLNTSDSTFTLISEVKTSGLNKQIPIIVMSKAGQEHLVETAFELGADDYVSHQSKLQELSLRINILARCRSKAQA
ncbi:MAG: response regulator [Chitinophagaceae bacterium]|nr:response regulator [Chitinophagaceae bacterium]